MLTDPAAILTALGLPAATAVTRMAGFEATVWRVELADDRVVAVRALRPGRSSRPELAALRMAADRTTAAPAVLAAGRVGDQDTIVTSWCPGRPVGDLLAETTDAHALGVAFGAAHGRLHLPVDGASLCHNDFQPFNVLARDGAVTGIVDWSMGGLGDPCADLAWTEVVLALGPAVFAHLAPVVDDFVAGWRHGYGTVTPFPDADRLRPFLVAAAARQAREWRERADAGEVPAAAAELAEQIQRRWSR